MKKKRLYLCILALCLTASFCGCRKKAAETESETQTVTETETQTEKATEKKTEKVTEVHELGTGLKAAKADLMLDQHLLICSLVKRRWLGGF